MYIVRDTSPVPFRTNTRSLGKSSDSLKNSLYSGQSPVSQTFKDEDNSSFSSHMQDFNSGSSGLMKKNASSLKLGSDRPCFNSPLGAGRSISTSPTLIGSSGVGSAADSSILAFLDCSFAPVDEGEAARLIPAVEAVSSGWTVFSLGTRSKTQTKKPPVSWS